VIGAFLTHTLGVKRRAADMRGVRRPWGRGQAPVAENQGSRLNNQLDTQVQVNSLHLTSSLLLKELTWPCVITEFTW
jgi:hypothetical protein